MTIVDMSISIVTLIVSQEMHLAGILLIVFLVVVLAIIYQIASSTIACSMEDIALKAHHLQKTVGLIIILH